MGCKQSELREDGEPINPENKPQVPLQCWYALPFTEQSSMPFTTFHDRNKGHVLFSNRLIPTRRAELEALGPQGPDTKNRFILGAEPIYGIGYLHNSALHIEYTWRLRVAHNGSASKYDKPFLDMLLGVKVFLNNILIPDSAPHEESLPQCTATYKAHEGCTQWRAVPLAIWPEENSIFMKGNVYLGLVFSVLQAFMTLEPGDHEMRIEVVYGCKSESNFCTDFISRGTATLTVNGQTQRAAERLNAAVVSAMSRPAAPVTPIPNPTELCAYCGAAKRYVCNTCYATICGSTKCVWSTVVGYPFGCTSHAAV